MDINNITVEEFIEMKKRMDEAENDTTPYVITDDAEISVVGDPNNTEIKKHDYVLRFYYPNTPAWKKKLESEGVDIFNTTPNYIGVERSYDNVWVAPRVYTSVQTTFAELYQFFNVVTEDGEIRDLTPAEIIEAVSMLDQDMMDAMFHVVAIVLGIPREEEQFILPIKAIEAVMSMIEDFPEIINGVDFFSDKSSEIETTNQ